MLCERMGNLAGDGKNRLVNRLLYFTRADLKRKNSGAIEVFGRGIIQLHGHWLAIC
jgi:hypothetical protein